MSWRRQNGRVPRRASPCLILGYNNGLGWVANFDFVAYRIGPCADWCGMLAIDRKMGRAGVEDDEQVCEIVA